MLKYVLAIACLLFVAPLTSFAQSAPAINPPTYCTTTGGVVQSRTPEYGTNGGTPLVLAYPRDFCDYVSKDGSTHIDLLLTTLVTKKPTLAALAYYAKTKVNLRKCAGGPGSCYCSGVGGTDEFGGVSAAGGGWVLSTNVNDVLDVCAFPDLSAIDAYGLFYHSHGIIRGRSLKGLLRFPDPY
jgi:hypothetical protein